MADSFQQRISLEGAEDILAKLKAIGLEGTKAFGDVKKALESVNPSLNALNNASLAAQRGIAGFSQALGGLTQVLGPVNSGLSSLLNTFGAFGRAGGAAAAVGGLLLFTKSAADSVIATQNMAQAFGLTIEQYKALGKAAQTAGVDQDTLNTALGRFSQKVASEAQQQAKTLIEITSQLVSKQPTQQIGFFDPKQIDAFRKAVAAAEVQVRAIAEQVLGFKPSPFFPQFTQQIADLTQHSEEFRNSLRAIGLEVPAFSFAERGRVAIEKLNNSFASLGITLLTASGQAKEPFQVFLDFADKIKNTPDGFQKAALASKAFGRTAGPELIAALNLGRDGIEQIRAALAKDGVLFSDAQVNAARQFRQSLIELEASSNSFKKTVLETFGPVLTFALKEIVSNVQTVKQAFAGLGSALTTGQVNDFVQQIKDKFAELPTSVQSTAKDVADAFVRGLTNGLLPVKGVIDNIKNLFKSAQPQQGASSFDEAGFIGVDFTKTTQQLPLVVNGLGQVIGGLRQIGTGIQVVNVETAKFRSRAEETGATFSAIAKTPPIKPMTIVAPDTKTQVEAVATAVEKISQSSQGFDESGFENLTAAVEPAKSAIEELDTASEATGNIVFTAFETMATGVDNVFRKITDLIRAMRELATIPPPDIGSGSGTPALGEARGGYIWGPGTGTSDSILARLSRGEFVVRAAAVSHYGPQLMAALNAMRLPRLPGFALGGLAEGLGRTLRANLAIPGLATGGAIPAPARAATVPITLDLRTDRGRFRGQAMADRDVAEALSRFAVIDQITSMGKKSGAF